MRRLSVDSSMIGSWDQEYDRSNIFLRPYDIINVREVKNYRSSFGSKGYIINRNNVEFILISSFKYFTWRC